jgi:hypothetical protein
MAEFHMPNDWGKPPTEQEMLERVADMSYTSPITEYLGQMRIEHENAVLKAIQEFDIRVDKDELIKALKYDRDQYRKGFIDGCRGSYDRIIERAKADTVNKMKEKVYEVAQGLDEVDAFFLKEMIDQIEKEVLEGEQNDHRTIN